MARTAYDHGNLPLFTIDTIVIFTCGAIPCALSAYLRLKELWRIKLEDCRRVAKHFAYHSISFHEATDQQRLESKI